MKKAILPALMAVLLTFLTGCGGFIYSDYRSTEGIELIRAMGIDYDRGKIKITACSGEGADGSAPKLIMGEAQTMDMALSQVQKNTAKEEAVFSHTEYLVIGEEAARHGIQGYLDYVERSAQMQIKTALLVVKGQTAEEMLSGVLSNKISAPDILTSLEAYMEDASVGTMFTCQEIAVGLAERGGALACAVELTRSGEESEDKPEKMISPSGYAVIKEGKLEDFIDLDTAIGVAALLGEATMNYMDVDDGAGGKLGLRLTEIKTEYTPVFTDGRLTAVDVYMSGNLHIEEVQNQMDITSDEFRRDVEKRAGRTQILRLERAIKQARQTGVDYLGIGGVLERAHPLKFIKSGVDWEKDFPEMVFNINVALSLNWTHDIMEPVNIKR